MNATLACRAGLVLGLLVATLSCLAAWRTEHRIAGAYGFPLDDTWIHLQIARNLAQGHGWSYNPGAPVQNSSGPLWTALLAIGFFFGSSVWFAKVLSFLCLLACIVSVWRLARLLTNDGFAAGLCALLAGTYAFMIRQALTAMETTLAALLTIACIDSFYRWRTGRRRFVWAVLAALATATRPESLVLVPLLALERWWRATGPRTRSVLLEVAVAGLVLLPYFALNLSLSGALFPTTFGAKTGATGLPQALRHFDLRELVVSLTLYPYVWTMLAIVVWGRANLPLLLSAPIGAYAIARGPHRALAPGLLLLLFPALRGIAAPHGTPWIQNGRYIGSIMPIFLLCAGVGITSLLRASLGSLLQTGARRFRVATLAAIAVAVLALVVVAVRFPHKGPGPLGSLVFLVPSGAVRRGMQAFLAHDWLGPMLVVIVGSFCLAVSLARAGLLRTFGIALLVLSLELQWVHGAKTSVHHAKAVRDIEAMDVELGRWVHDNVPPGTLVTVNDIGAIAFFGERPIVDAIGLATPELVPYITPLRLRTLLGLRELRPPYAVIFMNWFPQWTIRPSLFTPLYVHSVEDNTVLGGAKTMIYRTHWDRFDRYYSKELIDKLDPPAGHLSFAGHWQRGLRNMNLVARGATWVDAGNEALQNGKPAEAEKSYRKALSIDPTMEPAYSGLFEVNRLRGDRDGAIAILQGMIRSTPTPVTAYEALADMRVDAGENADVKNLYESVLALQPDNIRVLQKLESWCEAHGDSVQAGAYRARREELESDLPDPVPPLPRRVAAAETP